MQYDSVINEAFLSDDKSLWNMFIGAFEFGRKLKPKIKKRKTCAVDSVGEAKLLINVIRGTDVPVRTSYYHTFMDYIANAREGSAQQEAYKKLYFLKQVETFLEIKLVDPETGFEKIQRTSVSEGQNPEWNELLEFALTAKNKVNFTKEELEQSKMMVFFTLFD
jgi:hypothetical protein